MFINKLLKFLMLLLLAGCVSKSIDYPTVKNFDFNKYSGTWYEMARYDHSFERGMEKVTASYSLKENGKISVLNRGFLPEKNKWKEARGTAYVKSPGYLRVSFFGPFYGDYKVLYLDESYTKAIVGSSSKKYLWILVRKPGISIKDLVDRAEEIGYDTSKLIYVKQ